MKTLIVVALLATFGYVRLNDLNQQTDYNNYNLYEIYAIGAVMPAIAFPIFPEVSKEHFGLMTSNGQTIVDENDFFIKSKVVSKAVNESCKTNREVPLNWNMSSYQISFNYQSYVEARVSLAANGGKITCENNEPKVVVNVNYPKRAMATFVKVNGIPLLQIQEGMFNALEENGWYKPYKYVWKLNGQNT